jgi:hypothetical protein
MTCRGKTSTAGTSATPHHAAGGRSATPSGTLSSADVRSRPCATCAAAWTPCSPRRFRLGPAYDATGLRRAATPSRHLRRLEPHPPIETPAPRLPPAARDPGAPSPGTSDRPRPPFRHRHRRPRTVLVTRRVLFRPALRAAADCRPSRICPNALTAARPCRRPTSSKRAASPPRHPPPAPLPPPALASRRRPPHPPCGDVPLVSAASARPICPKAAALASARRPAQEAAMADPDQAAAAPRFCPKSAPRNSPRSSASSRTSTSGRSPSSAARPPSPNSACSA